MSNKVEYLDNGKKVTKILPKKLCCHFNFEMQSTKRWTKIRESVSNILRFVHFSQMFPVFLWLNLTHLWVKLIE